MLHKSDTVDGILVMNTTEQTIGQYLTAIESAQNEEVKRQRFIALLQSLFGAMKEAKPIIEEFISGAEKKVTRINKPGKKSDYGRADTQYRSIIIEFEKDLEKTGEHAKGQLVEYFTGNWNSGNKYDFSLIASDCKVWKLYTAQVNMPDKGKSLAVEDVELIERETFVLTTDNLMDFFYFLDARLFNSEKIKPSLKAIREHFSSKSQAYYSVTSCLKNTFHRRRSDPNVKVAYEQWSRF